MNHIIDYAAALLSIAAILWIIVSNVGRIRKVIFGSVLGYAALMIVSRILPNISVGINAFTCMFCGILGVPGFLTLFVLKLLI